MFDKCHHKIDRRVHYFARPPFVHEMSRRLAKWPDVSSRSPSSSRPFQLVVRLALKRGCQRSFQLHIRVYCGVSHSVLGSLRAWLSIRRVRTYTGIYDSCPSTMFYRHRATYHRPRAAIIGSASSDALVGELTYSDCEWRFASFEPAHTKYNVEDEGNSSERPSETR